MLFSYQTTDESFNSKMRQWTLQARWSYGMMLLMVFATPLMAMYAQNQVDVEISQHWLVEYTINNWVKIYACVVALMFCFIELTSIGMMQTRREKYPIVIKVALEGLCKKAGFTSVPEVVYEPKPDKLIAGAGRSLLYGRKIVLHGDLSRLKQHQLVAVLAHEIAHLMMRDVRSGHIAMALRLALRMVNLLTMMGALVAMFSQQYELFWLLGITFMVTAFGNLMAKLYYLKYSRVCEYRADAIAVQLTSKEHRKHLIDAIKRVHEVGLLVKLRNEEKRALEWGRTHPSIRNRARSLGIKKLLDSLGLAS